MNFFSGGEGAGAGRVRRALIPSVLFLFCAASLCPAAGALASCEQGAPGVQAFQLMLPLLLIAAAAALLCGSGTAFVMAGAEAEGNRDRKREAVMTGAVLVLVTEGILCAAAAAFPAGGLYPGRISPEAGAAVRMWMKGLVPCLPALGLFLFFAILLFAEGGEKQAAAVCAATCALQTVFSLGVFRIRGGAGFGYSMAAACLAGAGASCILSGRREKRSGRPRLSLMTARQILSGGLPEAEACACTALSVLILNTWLVMTGRAAYLPAAFYACLAYGSFLLLGRGLALGFDPMLRVYRAESNEKGILLLMRDGFLMILVVCNVWMALLFLGAGFLSGVWISSPEEIRTAGITAARLLAPFSVFYCISVFLEGYYRAVGEGGTARFFRLTSLAVWPLAWGFAGIRLAGLSGLWTGIGAAGFFSLITGYAAVRFRGRKEQKGGSGFLLLDRDFCESQFYEICPADAEGRAALLSRVDSYLTEKKVPEYEQLRILQLLKELTAGICQRAGDDAFYMDCTISASESGTFQVILRDDGPLTDKADPRHAIRSFRMYGLSRSIRTGADAKLAPASAENRTVFRV